jgi:hypothetical protein
MKIRYRVEAVRGDLLKVVVMGEKFNPILCYAVRRKARAIDGGTVTTGNYHSAPGASRAAV